MFFIAGGMILAIVSAILIYNRYKVTQKLISFGNS